ncbi:glutathione S-transferase theta-1-like isoform X2 [Dunckerocampus dactyliophorus]|uniref:glutathione S-transferase theta-1-like isoform X2 n=1 Tax=Dunckerocampus dactyliophorus TaxID=161453 RepID=UPI002405E1E2|nr:glutathione S-transferase theta-1-like isoform X2 [Dunckerocampus dactyliophorus]
MATDRLVNVYLDLLSQPCWAVHILLNAAKIPHQVHTVALSDAILKYLCRKYAVAEHWYPQQPERRARVDEYTAWHHTNTRPHAAKVFLLEVLFPTRSGSAVDEAGLARAVSQLDEPMFLRKQAFLCGDDITLADLRAHAASRWQQTRPAGTSPAAALEDTGPVGAGRPLPRLPRRPVCHQRLPQGQAVTQPMLM